MIQTVYCVRKNYMIYNVYLCLCGLLLVFLKLDSTSSIRLAKTDIKNTAATIATIINI